MEHGVGKYRRKTIRKNKPYNRPPKKSVFTRVTDTFKSIISPFTLGWISNKDDDDATGQELESSVDEAAGCSHPIIVQSSNSNQDKLVKSSDATMDGEATVEKTATIVDNKRGSSSSIVPQLWKNKIDDNHHLPQVDVSDSHKPTFNPSSYTLRERSGRGIASPLTPTLNISRGGNGLSRDSSFYNGPTQFGGALNTSMNNYHHNTSLNTSLNTSSARYSIPRIQQVKVLPNKRRKISFVSNNTTTSPMTSSQHNRQKSYGGGVGNLSSTAEKILKALEKLNTPVSDVRRIPISERKGTPYAVTRSRRKRDGMEITNNKRKPPVSNGMTSSTPARLSQLKQIPHDNSLVSSKIRFTGKSPATTKPTSSAADDVISPFKSPHTPLNTKEAPIKIGSSGGGKMKNNRTRSHAPSAGSNEDDNQYESHLPLGSNVTALPLGGTLPSFGKFGNPSSSSTPACKPTTNKIINDDVIKSTPKPEKKISSSSSINFSFSSPKALEKANNVAEEEEAVETKDLPDFSFSKPVPTSTTAEVKSIGFVGDDKTTSTSSKKSSPITSSLKKGSVMDILRGGKPSVVVPSNTTTKAVPPQPPKKKKWECETCMIRNDDDVIKCVACTTPKPGTEAPPPSDEKTKKRVSFGLPPSMQEVTGAGGSTAASSGNKKWSCPTCMVNNKADDLKCVCCSEAKPGSSKPASASSQSAPKFSFAAPSTTNSSSGSMFKAPSMKLPTSTTTSGTSGVQFGFSSSATSSTSNDVTSTVKPLTTKKNEDRWTCSICMIRNDSNKMKCAACEAPNPNQPSSESVSSTSSGSSGFKYGPTSASLIKFAAPPPSETPATKTPASFGFSAPSSTSGDKSASTTAKTPSFGFSTPSSTSSDKSASTTAKAPASFGFSAPSSTSGDKSASTTAKAPATFGFGKASSSAGATSTGGDKSVSSGSFKLSASTELPKVEKCEESVSSEAPPSYQFDIKSATTSSSKSSTAPSTAGFSFGAVTSSSDNKTSTSSFSKPPAASFGGFGTKSTAEVKTPASTGGFSGFGTSGGTKTPAPLMFGGATSGEKPSATGGANFSFGAKSTAAAQPASEKPAATFNFNSTASCETTTKNTGAATFSFGAASKPAPTPEKSAPATFSFGAKPAESKPAAPAATFQFGQKQPSNPTTMFGGGAAKPSTMFGTSNTSSASSGLFGAKQTSSTDEPKKNLFGSSSTATSAAPAAMFGTGSGASTMFGAANKTPVSSNTSSPFSAKNTGGLFGSATQEKKDSTKSSSSIFGGAGDKPASGAASIFGGATTTAPASSSDLFGGAKKGGGFGNSGGGGGMFGGASSQSSGQFGASSSPFKFAGASQQPSSGGGMFGSAQQQTPSSGFKFGEKQPTAVTQQVSAGGGFKFGSSSTQQQTSSNSGFSFNQTQQQPSTTFQFGNKQPTTSSTTPFFGTQQQNSTAPPSVSDNSMFSIGATESGMKRSAAGGNRPVRKAQRRLRK